MSKSYFSICTVVFFFHLGGVTMQSQERIANIDLTEDREFFEEQLSALYAYYELQGTTEILRIKDLEIEKASLTLNLMIGGLSDWIAVHESYDKEEPNAYGKDLFEKFVHLMEVPEDLATIWIRSMSNEPNEEVTVMIAYRDDAVRVFGPDLSLRGSVERTYVITKPPSIVTASIEEVDENILELIRTTISDYYVSRNVDWEDGCCLIDEDANSLTFYVRNLKGEIIHDCGLFCPFEYIVLNIRLNRDTSDNLRLTYNLQGKYGSGIFIAPRKSGYKDMELNKYKSYLPDYIVRIKNLIKDVLKN